MGGKFRSHLASVLHLINHFIVWNYPSWMCPVKSTGRGIDIREDKGISQRFIGLLLRALSGIDTLGWTSRACQITNQVLWKSVYIQEKISLRYIFATVPVCSLWTFRDSFSNQYFGQITEQGTVTRNCRPFFAPLIESIK